MLIRALCCAPTVVHWVPLVDAVRTFCLAPGMAERLFFKQFRQYRNRDDQQHFIIFAWPRGS